MKKNFLLFVVLLFIGLKVNAQTRIDVGGYISGSFYLGDINPALLFYSVKPSGGALFRYNFDQRYALRGSIMYGTLSGNDNDFDNVYQKARSHSFSTPVADVAIQAEFNFLPYAVANDKARRSTYIFTGLCYYIVPNTISPSQIGIPLGIGYKINLKNKWAAGVEWSFRKTFTDNIDGLNGKDFFPDTFKQTGFANTRDWYSFCGIFITYMIFSEDMKCAAYGDKKKF